MPREMTDPLSSKFNFDKELAASLSESCKLDIDSFAVDVGGMPAESVILGIARLIKRGYKIVCSTSERGRRYARLAEPIPADEWLTLTAYITRMRSAAGDWKERTDRRMEMGRRLLMDNGGSM